MVIVFATVVFTGSVIKGARDHVGGLFAKSIKMDQESSKRITEPRETVKTKPYERNLQHHPSDHTKNSTTTQTRCFQSYSSKDFFSCTEEILTVKDQGNLNRENRELKKSKQVRSKTATPAATKQNHAINETSRILDEGPELSATEDNEPFDIRIRNKEKSKCVSFQTNACPRSQFRPRRKRPKTLKKELEEAGLVIDESGQTQIQTKPHEECSTPKQWGEVDKEVQFKKLNQDESGNPGNLQTSLDDTSIREDKHTGSEHDQAERSNDALVPVMMNENKEEEKSSTYKTHSKGDAMKVENENMHRVYKEEEKEEAASIANNTDNHRPTQEAEKVQIPQESICYHCKKGTNADHLTESEPAGHPIVYAGDTVPNKNKNQNHESGDIISETGDFGKPTERNAVKVSAANVNVGDMTRVKHRSQKGFEDKPLLHRDTQRENGATRKDSANLMVDATRVTEDNYQQSIENSKNEPQSFGLQHIQVHVVQTNVNGTGDVVNDTSSVIPISSNHSNKPQFLKTPLRSTVYSDALDQVVGRFMDDGYGEVDTTQYSVELSEDLASHQTEVKERLHKFLEDFGACDRARAHWSRDFHLARTRQRQNGDVIVMAVENRDQQRRRLVRRQLRARIFQATLELEAITKETKDAEARHLMLVQEVGKAGSRSELTEELARQEERNLCREPLLRCCKLGEDVKAVDTRHRAIEVELNAMKRREWKTNIMHRAALGEIKLLDHRIVKEQSLQEEQREKRLRHKRRRFQRTSLKVNTLLALTILQVILVIIIALWRL